MRLNGPINIPVVFCNVSACIIRQIDGKEIVVENKDKNNSLSVYILRGKINDNLFIENVIANSKKSKTVEELAFNCNYLSTKTFTRHFKKNFDMSPKQWMMEMKENEVRYYLKNTDYTLTKIAALLGFANVSHLWNFCIKMTGMPPNKIREDQFDQPTEEKI